MLYIHCTKLLTLMTSASDIPETIRCSSTGKEGTPSYVTTATLANELIPRARKISTIVPDGKAGRGHPRFVSLVAVHVYRRQQKTTEDNRRQQKTTEDNRNTQAGYNEKEKLLSMSHHGFVPVNEF